MSAVRSGMFVLLAMALFFMTDTCAMTSCGSVCRTSQAGVVTSCPRGCKCVMEAESSFGGGIGRCQRTFS
uniref:Putative conserved secreted protein ovary overexpressed n=1 Tax=Rhipicephalus microplus TaxID=6941 RepID=A0A6M2D183_RHIMP